MKCLTYLGREGWYDKRPLWDIGMIVLLVGGLASSGIGLFLGVKRVWLAGSRTVKSWVRGAVTTPAPNPVSRPALGRADQLESMPYPHRGSE